MGKDSKIEWTDHTFNPWTGCTKVSAACDHCYAEAWAKRTGKPELWNGERRRTSAKYWQQPHQWGLASAMRDVGEPKQRVFCASLADVFDNQVPAEWRADLWRLIRSTPELNWLLLTKRPQNIEKMRTSADEPWPWPFPNVWLGTTVESPDEYRRIKHLAAVPAACRFLSMEPLLAACPDVPLEGIGLVICGGESGPGARPMNPNWARSLRDQCSAAGVPFHFKQWGEFVSVSEVEGAGRHHQFPDGATVRRAGKAKAGRTLDGIEHNGMPT